VVVVGAGGTARNEAAVDATDEVAVVGGLVAVEGVVSSVCTRTSDPTWLRRHKKPTAVAYRIHVVAERPSVSGRGVCVEMRDFHAWLPCANHTSAKTNAAGAPL
jgi:hypothetical protein